MVHGVATATAIAVMISVALATNGKADEAAASFEAQNGFLSPERFAEARRAFEEIETPATGLGIHFNESSCATCHVPFRAGLLPGGSGPITELRAGFIGRSGEFFPAPGGTLITNRAVGRATPEITALADGHNVRDRFITPSLFGAGFVEAVPDEVLQRIARDQARQSGGRISGFAREVAILEAPGATAVGRFGWAAQHASLLSFAADAYLNEMGITSPLRLDDNAFLGNPADDGIADPEDSGGMFGVGVEAFVDFMRALSAPPRVSFTREERRDIERGAEVFESVGCATCHVPELQTARARELVNGGSFRVPDALGNKTFHPYADFLLHDIGTSPKIVREGMPREARGRIRTAALWGIATRVAIGEPLLHDGSARTIEDAIARHANSASREAESFQRLSQEDRARLLRFLNIL
jgi:CxxC motif-containing protein (DUF1111 family)